MSNISLQIQSIKIGSISKFCEFHPFCGYNVSWLFLFLKPSLIVPHRHYRYKFDYPFTGRSGVGKTETAVQIAREVEALDDCPYISGCFRSFQTGVLLGDLKKFALEHDLNLQSLNEEKTYDDIIIGKILGELFISLNSGKYQNVTKFLIFDDAELDTSVIQCIDQHLSAMKHINGKKWKIVVTTRNVQPEKWLEQCLHLSQDNFKHIEVFSKDETRHFMSELSTLQRDQLDTLHELLTGMPLALLIARRYVLSNDVSRIYTNKKILMIKYHNKNAMDQTLTHKSIGTHPTQLPKYLGLTHLIYPGLPKSP